MVQTSQSARLSAWDGHGAPSHEPTQEAIYLCTAHIEEVRTFSADEYTAHVVHICNSANALIAVQDLRDDQSGSEALPSSACPCVHVAASRFGKRHDSASGQDTS